MALVIMGLLGGLFVAAFVTLEQSVDRIRLLHDEAQKGEEIFRSFVLITKQLDEVLVEQRMNRIPAILADNETLLASFSAYKTTAESFNLKSNLMLAVENEELILNTRQDIYSALTLYRDGHVAEAREHKQRIERNVYHLATAIDRSNAQRQAELAGHVRTVYNLRRFQLGSMLAIFALGAVALVAASAGYSRSIIRNLRTLTAFTEQVSSGQFAHPIEIGSNDEVEQLAQAFNRMIQNLQSRQEQVVAQRTTIEEHAAHLDRTVVELRQAMRERDELNLTVRELSSPVLPVMDGILVLPLIGVIDEERAALFMEALLSAVERHQAQTVIIDVTGVPTIDENVARALLSARAAVVLLGAETILVGIRSDVARTVVALGASLAGVVTRANLQGGLRYAMSKRARKTS